jgi:hypothetical protein
VKNVAKLVLFLGFSFIGLLVFAALLALLQGWTSSALTFPPDTGVLNVFSGISVDYLYSSLSAAFYLSILLGLNFAVHHRVAYPAAFAVILIFSLVFSGASLLGIGSLGWTKFDAAGKKPPAELAKPGLIITPSPLSGDQWVFLEDPYKPGGARAVFSQGKSLNFQGQGASLARVRLPFFTENNEIFGSISRDIEQSSRIFSARFNAGLLPFCVYAGSLAAFLLSLGCLVNIRFWSLANLFFGALAFRGVLALEHFLNQPHIHQLAASFTGGRFSESLVTPVVFCALTVLILLYAGLVYLARGKISDD